jgi:hypothetical protein
MPDVDSSPHTQPSTAAAAIWAKSWQRPHRSFLPIVDNDPWKEFAQRLLPDHRHRHFLEATTTKGKPTKNHENWTLWRAQEWRYWLL